MIRAGVKSAAVLALVAGAAAVAFGQADQKTLFVTNNVGSPGSVSAFRVSDSGVLSFVGLFNTVGVNPQDCGVTADGRNLIVLNATASVTTEDIYTARVNPDSTLTVNPVPSTVGDGPLALHVTRENFLLVPSATSDSLSSYRIASDATSFISSAFAGGFPTKPAATPDGKFAFTIGSASPNDVCTFEIGPTGALVFTSGTDIAGGGGFGAAVHPSGDTLYVSTGLQNLILQYSINTSTGLISLVASHSSGGAGNNSAVEIGLSPDGAFMYVCHVVSDSLSVLRVNADRSLTTTGFSYSIGNDIRDVISDDRFVYLTDESTLGGGQAGVIVFRREPNGSLTSLGAPAPTGGGRPQFMSLWTPPTPPPCLGDANGDEAVNFADITSALENWGSSGPTGDANQDGVVSFADVTAILENWGACP